MPAANTVAEMVVKLSADTSALDASLSKADKQVAGFGDSIKGGIGGGIGFGLVAQGISLVGSAIGAAKGSIIDLNSSLEQSKIAFTTMLGGAQQADDFLKQLQQFAAQTPFEFPDLVMASKRMLAFGFDSKSVVPLLTAVGDAVAAVGGGAETIDGVTTALGQMQAKGKVSAEEMGQLAERGIPAWDMLAKAMGVSVGEAMDQVSKGAVKASTFIEAFQTGTAERFGGMMAKQSLTFAGAMSTIMDSVQMATATAFKPLFELLSEGAVAISAFVQSDEFNEWAQGVTVSIGEMIAMLRTLIEALKPAARFLWENRDAIAAVAAALATFVILTTVVGWITAAVAAISAVTAAITASGGVLAALGALVALLGGPVTLIIAAIALAVGALAYAWANNWGDIQGKTEAVVDFLSGIPDTIAGYWDAITTATDGLVTAVTDAWDSIKTSTESIWNGIKDFLVDWWRVIAVVLGGPIGALAVLVIDNWESIKSATETIWAAITNILTAVWDLIYRTIIEPQVKLVQLTIEAAWEAIRAAIDEKMTAVQTILQTAWDAITTAATTALNALLTLVRDTIFEPIRAAVAEKIEAARAAVATALDAIKSYAESVMNPFLSWWESTIWTPISTAVSTAMDGAKTAFQTAIDGFKSAVDSTMGAVKSTWESTWGAIQKAAESPAAAMDKLIELVNKLKGVMPEWLIPHSPTPLQVGIEGIMKAAQAMNETWKSLGSAVKGANGEIAQYIANAAMARGIDPGIALRIAQHEGGLEEYNKVGKFATGWSWWPFQLHYGGKGYEHFGTTAGMGNDFTRRTGWAPGDPKAWKDSIDFALDHAAKAGWGAWYGRGPAGVGAWEGIPGHAAGGWVGLNGPELGILGERGPEYIVPHHAFSGGSGAMQHVVVDVAIGGHVAEQIYVTGRDLAVRRGRGTPGFGRPIGSPG